MFTLNKEICQTCGQNISPRKERITKGLLTDLILFRQKIIEKGKNKIRISEEMNLSKSQYNNFQKLRYHALVAKVKENGERINGVWLLTKRGTDFLNGKLSIPKYVVIFNNRIQDYSTEYITVKIILKGKEIPYWENINTVEYKTEYLEKPVQGSLFQ